MGLLHVHAALLLERTSVRFGKEAGLSPDPFTTLWTMKHVWPSRKSYYDSAVIQPLRESLYSATRTGTAAEHWVFTM
jgi:hypothetical protein